MGSVSMPLTIPVPVSAFAAAAAGLLLAACGQVGEAGESSIGGPDDAVTVTEALAAPEDRRLRVAGSLLWDGTTMWLCDAIAESYPPQCVQGAELTGYDPAQIPPETPDMAGVRLVERLHVVVHRSGDHLVADAEDS
jgi:hypothetical protein